MQSRRHFIRSAMGVVAAGTILGSGACAQEASRQVQPQNARNGAADRTRPPNFVFILADDLGSADVSWRGSEIRTPNLDRLVRQGVELTSHYTAPVCSPTRAGLLTGRYWSRFGIVVPDSRQCLPDNTPTIAGDLKSAGYRTALVGKWHLGGAELTNKRPGKFGFDFTYGSLDGAVNPFTHVYTHGGKEREGEKGIPTWHRNGQIVNEEGHATDLIAREAINFIRESKDQPFFLYVPFTAPHEKCLETEEWTQKVQDHITDPKRRNYAAMVEHMDDAIGRIIAALDTDELRKNTLIVFASDNGGMGSAGQGRNNPLRGQKGQVYEGGIRNLAFAVWPERVKTGQRSEPTCIVDWAPTFCSLANLNPPEAKWDGRSIWPLLSGARMHWLDRPIYIRGVRGNADALRYGDWKLIILHPRAGDVVELYNLKDDPAESRNLAGDEPEKVEALREMLTQLSAADNSSVSPEVTTKPGGND